MNKFDYNDTICALSTPQGVSAIALIRISGLKAISAVNEITKKDLNSLKGYQAVYTSILDGFQIIDDVIVTIFKGPHSYTGEDVVEIACHGSVFIQQKIIHLLIDHGIRMAQPGEFSQKAFFNGKLDLSQTEAIADLIHSSSAAAHNIAVKQMRGGISNELKALREQMIHFASLVELELDFAEEDVEFADRSELMHHVEEVFRYVVKLKETFKLGNAIKNGVPTVLAGRPNAGKSTLLNNLLNEERAIVSDIPGTTRDAIEEVIIINGIQFRLIDTAGIREAGDAIEKMGIDRTMDKIATSTLLVYVYDQTSMSEAEVNADLEKIGYRPEATLILANKSDKSDKSDNFLPKHHLSFSAKFDKNEKIKEAIAALIGDYSNASIIVTNARHAEALGLAQQDLEKVIYGLNNGISGDFLAMDIRSALFHLGSITGEVSTDDLLGNIFANFCIGK